jgi:hypothetical protein
MANNSKAGWIFGGLVATFALGTYINHRDSSAKEVLVQRLTLEAQKEFPHVKDYASIVITDTNAGDKLSLGSDKAEVDALFTRHPQLKDAVLSAAFFSAFEDELQAYPKSVGDAGNMFKNGSQDLSAYPAVEAVFNNAVEDGVISKQEAVSMIGVQMDLYQIPVTAEYLKAADHLLREVNLPATDENVNAIAKRMYIQVAKFRADQAAKQGTAPAVTQ